MKEIRMSDVLEVNAYWLVYQNENKEKSYIDLLASANSYQRATGREPEGLRCIGQRYEEKGVGCYELYNIGHTRILCSLKPTLFGVIAARLSGRDPAEARRAEFRALEERLNALGWKTEERK